MARTNSHRDPGGRYPLLRFAGSAFTGLGLFLMAAGGLLLAAGFYWLAAVLLGDPSRAGAPPTPPGVPTFPLPIGVGGGLAMVWGGGLLLSGLQCAALGAFCRLAIDIEANTRASADHLARIHSQTQPARDDAARFFVS